MIPLSASADDVSLVEGDADSLVVVVVEVALTVVVIGLSVRPKMQTENVKQASTH